MWNLPHRLFQNLFNKLGFGIFNILSQAVSPEEIKIQYLNIKQLFIHKQTMHSLYKWFPEETSSPVIPAPSELEVTQMMWEPVEEPETQNNPPY